MKNQKIGTLLGTIILTIITASAGMFLWKYENEKDQNENQSAQLITQQAYNTDKSAGVAFPAIPIQPGVSLEEIIKQAIYEETPSWKNENYNITVTIETNKENHAIGRFTYDGYNVIKDGSNYHNAGEGIWFAAESNSTWTLVNISYMSYWGNCQDFQKYNFPKDMTPDCWDTEKNILIDTSNPEMFYPNNLGKEDKSELIRAFVSYEKKSDPNYSPNNLYVRFDKSVGNYLNGTILFGRTPNHSAPYFLAVRRNGNWIIVYNGQDIPDCSVIEPYKFPKEIVGTCYDEVTKQEKQVL